MKKLFKITFAGFFVFFFFYLIGSFGNSNFNISFWGEVSLVCVSLFGGFSGLFTILFFFNKLSSKEIEKEVIFKKISRVEVIDHSKNLEHGGGRVFVKKDCTYLELSYQDKGRTLKIFLK